MSIMEELVEKQQVIDWLLEGDAPVPVGLSPKMKCIVKYLQDINGRGLNQWRVVYAQIAAVILDDDPDLAGRLVMVAEGEEDVDMKKSPWRRVGKVASNRNSHNYGMGSIVVHKPMTSDDRTPDYWLRPDGTLGNHLRYYDVAQPTREEVEELVMNAGQEWMSQVAEFMKMGGTSGKGKGVRA